MLVVLDGPKRQVFRRPLRRIAANSPAQVPAALAAVSTALRQGHHVAGWLAYELGHALEPRLADLAEPGPLLRLGVFGPPEAEIAPPAGRAWAGPLRPEWDQAGYETRFAAVKQFIAAGDIYQANLSFRARFPFLGDARALYEDLRAASGAGHCAYVDDGERKVLSLSPELFFDLAADGTITVRPMKGTAARSGQSEASDAVERAFLSTSPKDRAENLMIVDLIRNDLSRIGAGVAVRDLFQVETYPTLHTMVSTVTARKHPRAGVTALLKALFPCGSITGAPKIRAMEILDALETSRRGVYCGAVGMFAPDGSAQFNVAIRTATIMAGQGELGIGGGVVHDSDGVDEYAECLLKARFFEQAHPPLQLIETLGWNDGFSRLDAHLTRMAASARIFQMPFDGRAARLALDAAVAGKQGPHRVRITLDRFGVHDASAAPLEVGPAHWTYRLSDIATFSGDVLLAHKTNRRDVYDAPHPGVDEVLFRNERGELTEGARSNLFIRRGDILLTPPLRCGVLPGILRAELLRQGQAREAVLTAGDLAGAEVYFGNSLRGLIPARQA